MDRGDTDRHYGRFSMHYSVCVRSVDIHPSEYLPEHAFQYQFSIHALELGMLRIHIFHSFEIGCLHAAILAYPVLIRRIRDTLFPAEAFDGSACFYSIQVGNDPRTGFTRRVLSCLRWLSRKTSNLEWPSFWESYNMDYIDQI